MIYVIGFAIGAALGGSGPLIPAIRRYRADRETFDLTVSVVYMLYGGLAGLSATIMIEAGIR